MAVRVVVAGALGRMGREVCAAVSESDDLELVGGFDRAHQGEALADALGLQRAKGRLYDDVADLYDETRPEVVVDFTLYPVTMDVGREAVTRGISAVIGATGWTDEDVVSFQSLCDDAGVGTALVPNFAIGAVLMMRFAEEAARFYPTVEIVEMHHDGKLDKPSGTAQLTARRIETVRGNGAVPIHSMRLRGAVAHQEVVFGGNGELLTIRHDSLQRGSFMAGVLLAVRNVHKRRGLVIGLDSFLAEESGS
jgi:4-hydroxy-tetrahydrodipicolinate reductase